MAIEAELHDGTVLEFPEGTNPEVVQATVKRVLAEKYPPTLGGYVKETLKAPLRGAAGFLETAATGAASLLPEDYEKAVVEKAQKYAKKISPTAAPGYEESIPVRLAEGVGSMLAPAIIPGGIIGKGLAFGASGAGEARKRAQQAGATPEQISEATAQGVIPGLTDLLPFHYLMGSLGKTAITGMLSRGVRMATTAGVEGATEWAQAVMQNAIAQGYDPKQDMYEGASEEGAYGAGVGALAQGLLDAVFGRRAPRVKTTQQPTPAIEPQTIAAEKEAPPEGAVTAPAPQLTEALSDDPAIRKMQEEYAKREEDIATDKNKLRRNARIKKNKALKARIDEAIVNQPVTPVAPTAPKAAAPETTETAASEAAAPEITETVPEATKREETKGVGLLDFPKLSETTGNEYIDRAQGIVDIYGRGEHGLYFPHDFVSKIKNSIRELDGTDVRRRPGMADKYYYDRLMSNLKDAIANAKTKLTEQGAVNAQPAGVSGVGGDTTSAAAPVQTGAAEQPAVESVVPEGVGSAVAAAGPVDAGKVGEQGALTETKTEAPTETKTEAPTETKTEAPTETKTEAPTEDVFSVPLEEDLTPEKQHAARESVDIKHYADILNTTKNPNKYARAVENLVDIAEEIYGEGSSAEGKVAAAKALQDEDIPASDIEAARSRLRSLAARKPQNIKDDVDTPIARAKYAVEVFKEDLKNLSSLSADEIIDIYAHNKEVATVKSNLAEAKNLLSELRSKKARRSLAELAEPTGNTKQSVEDVLKNELQSNSELRRITTVLQSESELPEYLRKDGTKGVAAEGKIWLVADNIEVGGELGVLLHEAGAHIGFDKVLSDTDRARLADTVRGWGRGNDLKGQVAKEAIAKGGKDNDEVIAYAVEGLVNRGVRPTTFSAEGNWLKRIMAAFRSALSKLGFRKEVTPQELVDLAYGAAHIDAFGKDIEAGAAAEKLLFGKTLSANAERAMKPMRESYNKLRKKFDLEPVTDWSKPPEERIGRKEAPRGYVPKRQPRYSTANAAIANAQDAADKLFSGPSAGQGIVSRTIEGLAGPDKFKRVGNAFQTVRTKFADKAAPWKDFLQTVDGGKVRDAMGMANAVERIEAATKTSGIQLAVMELGGLRIDPKTGLWHAYKTDASFKDIVDTLNKAVSKYEGVDSFKDIERLFNFASIARRESELKKEGRLGSADDQIKPTLSDKQINDGLALYEAIPEIKQSLEIFERLNNRLVDSMVTGGVFDADYAKMLKGNTGYVPWFRFSKDKDDNIKVVNPKEFTRGLINLSNMKDLKGARIEDIQINNVLDNMARLNNWMVSKTIGNHTAVYMSELGKSLGIAERVGGMQGGEKGQVIKVYKGGKEVYYAFDDPAFVPAFKGNEIALGSLVKMMAVPANIARKSITVLNPVFSIAQLPQDAMRAFVEGGLKNPWSIFPRVAKNFVRELINPTEASKRLREYGIIGRATDITSAEMGGAGYGFRRKLGYYDPTFSGWYHRLWDGLEHWQAASDAAIRSALYEQTMKETGNEVLALKRAREIINFDTQGSSSTATFLRHTVPFMGVQMIALNNLYRGLVLGQRLTEGDKAATKRAIYSSGIQLAVMATLYTMMVADDDDYKQRSDEERAHSFIIPGANLRIPVPSDGIGFIFKVLPEQITRYVVSEGVGSEDMGSRTLRGMGVGLLGIADWTGFIPMVGNPLVKTFIESKLNRSFFTGDAIVGKGKEGLEPYAQINENTSELARLIGEMSKEASKVLPEGLQSSAQVSPIKFDYLLKAVTSQVGASTMLLTNALFHAAEGKVTPSIDAKDFPMWKRFTFSDKDRADLEDFYEMRERVDTIARTYKDFINAGKGKEAAEYMSDPDNQRAYAMRKFTTMVEQQLTKFRQARKLIINDPKITDSDVMKEKLDALDAQQTKFLKSIQLARARAMAGF